MSFLLKIFRAIKSYKEIYKKTRWFALQVVLPPIDKISNDWSSGFSAFNWGHYSILHQGKWKTSCWERQGMLLGREQSTNTSEDDFFWYIP